MDSKPGSRFLSASDVEECIRNAGPIFHILSPGGRMPREIISRYDNGRTGVARLEGFTLRPPTIGDMKSSLAFNSKVHSEWLKHGALAYNGVALPGISFMEATGTFHLDSLGPGSYPGDYFLDDVGLCRTLESLSSVALSEAVKQHLTEGGDERLHLSAAGVNKYYCPPCPIPGAIIRGSCTCSPPSQYAFDVARGLLHDLWNGVVSFEDAYDNVRARISAALGIQTPHHIILHPSGTDAEFTPLLVGTNRAIALGCTRVINIVVGAGEVGSNTAQAAGGHHFSKYMPNGGIDSRETLLGSNLAETRVIELKARLPNGSMMPHFDQVLLGAMKEAESGSHRAFFIVHVVDGSKLGSHITNRKLVSQIQEQYSGRVLFALDACQARTEGDEMDWYLSQGAVVLITASKFYGAPGFCAAALVPASAASQLVEGAVVPPGLGHYLTKLSVPTALRDLRRALPSGPSNIGLLLRWTCGLAEMERLAKVGPMARKAIQQWVCRVEGLVRQKSPLLELLVDECGQNLEQSSQLGGVNSIVAFKLRSEAGGPSLATAGLRRIHQWLTADISTALPAAASEAERKLAATRCFVGQPVDLGDFAVLRLAMGASLACDLAEDLSRPENALRDDSKVLDKIVLTLKYQETLCHRKE